MKLLAFIGDFFTPMLPLLLFFYPHSTILCSTTLLHYSASFPCNPISSLSCILCSSVLLFLCCPSPALGL
ncbi:expressed protein [Phakopsora pachyrhizi]|uniref:Expressed protein n=1 Tax=Phakopsora pachyrhizi TaxID=170000 RepID=A0AAV0ARA0_PHAPC|nr:expressed protein [Phakopsora pachyrhizi]